MVYLGRVLLGLAFIALLGGLGYAIDWNVCAVYGPTTSLQ